MQNPFSGLASYVKRAISGERREYERVDMRELGIEAVIEGSAGRGYVGTLVNMSRIGAAVRYPIKLRVGISCTLALNDHSHKYTLAGSVIYNYDTGEEYRIVGVQFKEPIQDPEIIQKYGL